MLRNRALARCLFALWAGWTIGCEQPAEDSSELSVTRSFLSASDCPAGTNIVIGTAGADNLVGTSGADCLVGLGGADTLSGGGGDDFLIGGNGNDRLFGEAGEDQLYGEAGIDTLEGGEDDDRLEGHNDADTMRGGSGNDALYGGGGNDTIFGDDGDDSVFGAAGGDIIEGGSGADRLLGEDGSDTIRGGAGADRLNGGAQVDVLHGDDGHDVIDGGAAGDQLYGGGGDDVLFGNGTGNTVSGEDGDDAIVDASGNSVNGGAGTDACTGTGCELARPVRTGCTQASQCAAFQQCVVDIGLCLGCVADQDGDHVCNSDDGCPADPSKTSPGACGCGTSDADGDADGTPNCNDGCPADAGKVTPGACGCGTSDADGDADGTPDCVDGCPGDGSKTEPGACGCGVPDADSDADGTHDCAEECPADPNKVFAGACGCGVLDSDGDADGTPDCHDACASDPAKTDPGVCGCGISDADEDLDEIPDCADSCPGHYDYDDQDSDGVADGCDRCPGGRDWLDQDEDGGPDDCPIVVVAGRNWLPDGNVALADFDEDCDIDAALANGSELGVWRNDGTGTLTAPQSQLAINWPELAQGDLDGDGHADVAVQRNDWPAPATVAALYGSGDGSLTEQGTPLSGDFAFAPMQLADVTGDGALDAVFRTGLSLVVAVGATPPARGFVAVVQAQYPQHWSWPAIAAGDFDRNGDAEVAVVIDNALYVYNYEDGALYPEIIGWLSVNYAKTLAAGDVGGDGHDDLIMVDTSCPYQCPGRLQVLVGRDPHNPGGDAWFLGQHGAFGAPVETPIASEAAVQLADFSGDDKQEIVLSSYTETAFYGLDESDPLQRELQLLQRVGAAGYGFTPADVDGDGARDLVLRRNFGPGWEWWRNVDPDKADGGDHDADGVCNSLDVCPYGSDTADGDEDGVADGCDRCPSDPGNDPDADGICAAQDVCPASHNAIDADGDELPDACDLCPVDPFGDDDHDGDGTCNSGDLCPGANDTVDADEDGVPDGCAVMMLGPSSSGRNVVDVAAGDFDEDCFDDVVAITPDASWLERDVELWRGDGSGSFDPAAYLDAARSRARAAEHVRGADMDGDGHRDVVMTAFDYTVPWPEANLGVWRGSGSTSFVLHGPTGPSTGGYEPKLGDFDGDGWMDTVYNLGAQMRVRRGIDQPDAAFGSEELSLAFPNTSSGARFAPADADGDGDDEIFVFAGHADNSAHLYLLDHGPSGITTVDLGRSWFWSGGTELVAADFDGNGFVDIVMLGTSCYPDYDYVNEACGRAQTYWGIAPGSTPPPGVILQGGGHTFVAGAETITSIPLRAELADVTGDAHPEVIVSAYRHVTVLGVSGGPGGGAAPIQTFKLPGIMAVDSLDANGDGATDLIVATGDQGLQVLINVDASKQVGNDADGDGVCNVQDGCPAGDDAIDSDGDGIPDACEL